MKTAGAILETSGATRPYADSRPIVIDDLEIDGPGPGELMVRIEAAGVCHSDLSVVDGNRERPLPMLLGHEAAGIVKDVGDGVTDIGPGQRVVMTFLPRCEYCEECRQGGRLPCSVGSRANSAGELLHGGQRLHRGDETIRHHLGVSAFAEYAVVSRASVVPVDADVPPDIAAVLGCAVLTGGGAVVNSGRPRRSDVTMIVGLGGVGMAALLVALASGIERVIAVDALPDKLRLASRLGAHNVYSPEEVESAGVRADCVIECAGHTKAFETAFKATAPGGTTVTVGLPDPAAESVISPLTLTAEARTVVGSYLGSAVPSRDIPRYVELWRQGLLPLEELISSHIALREINSAFDALADGSVLRQVITFP